MSEVAKRQAGAPSKRTPEIRKRLIDCIARGVPMTWAARAVGIAYSTFCAWRADDPTLDDEIESAVAAAIEKRLGVIEKAADLGDTGCAKWLLEHLHPQFFSRSRVEITGADGAPLAAGIQLYLPEKKVPSVEVEPAKALQIKSDGTDH
jgi:hypothetical protein